MSYHDEFTATKVNGWPRDAGPLDTLHKLGIMPRDAQRPAFLNYQKTLTTQSGNVIYKCSAKVIDGEGLRVFAALTFENWNVLITSPAGTSEFDIRIIAAPTATAIQSTGHAEIRRQL